VKILRKNWLLAAGAAAILVGFAFLAGGSLSLGPLLLVVGYCLALPIYLWRNYRGGVGE
jgi:hypothetical protein